MTHLDNLKDHVKNIHGLENQEDVTLLNEAELYEIDLKSMASKLNPKKVLQRMIASVKSNDKAGIKKINSMLPKKNIIKPLLAKSIKGKEGDFKKSQTHFKLFFKSIKNDKIVSNLSNAMACMAVAINRTGDIDSTNKKISNRLETVMKKKNLNESENLNEFVFPTIRVTDESSAVKVILNIVAGVLQVTGELALMGMAATVTGGFIAPILVFIGLWLIWACLPDNLRDWWIVIPLDFG